MPPPQLPTLPPGPLTLAAARQLGLSDHQWRLKGLRRQTQTVRTLTEPESAHERAALFALAYRRTARSRTSLRLSSGAFPFRPHRRVRRTWT